MSVYREGLKPSSIDGPDNHDHIKHSEFFSSSHVLLLQGILVHTDSLPLPLPRGSRQEVEVAVPWPNEMFYYALAAWDGAGNR